MLWTDDARSAACDLRRCLGSALNDARDARPAAQGASAAYAGSALHEPRRGRRPADPGRRQAAPCARAAGGELAVNFYLANGGIVMPLLDRAPMHAAAARLRRLFPAASSSACRHARSCSAATSTASPRTSLAARSRARGAESAAAPAPARWLHGRETRSRRDHPRICGSRRAHASGCATTTRRAPSAGRARKPRRPPPRDLARLSELQYKMFADGRFAMLVVLQAIDGGGKTARSAACSRRSTRRAAP